MIINISPGDDKGAEIRGRAKFIQISAASAIIAAVLYHRACLWL